MKTVSATLVALLLSVGSPAFAQLSTDAAIAKAEAVLKNLQDGRAAEIVKELDPKLTAALPESKLTGVWPDLVGRFGAFKSIAERREGRLEDRQAVELVLAFEKETIVMRTVFAGDGKIGGLVFRPLGMALLPAKK